MQGILIILGVLLNALSASTAIPPKYVSDPELAEMPVIVVAHWDGAPIKAHNLVEGNALEEAESHTTLVIDRVLKGKVKPGARRLMLGWAIGWQKSGGMVYSFMSTQMVGDVEEVRQPNIWLLTRKRSWDKSDNHVYLTLSTYRGVQPLVLEPYFLALQKADPAEAVAKLLGHAEAAVCLRTLEYVHGGARPWPYWTEFDEWHRGKPDPSRKLPRYAPEVEKLLSHKDTEVRRLATAVYGSLLGEKAVERVRQVLSDEDGGVRAIAIGILAEHKDAVSGQRICRAARGIHDGFLGSAAVDRLAAWGDEAVVPAMIAFLREGEFAFRIGDDIGIPALRAQAALKKITGFMFPLDPERSLAAWQKVSEIRDRDQRCKALKELLPEDSEPLLARAVGDEHRHRVELVNRSRQSVWVTTMPADVEIRYTGSLSNQSGHARTREDFAKLESGQSITIPIELPEKFLLEAPGARSVKLHYWNNGAAFDLNAWIGALDVVFGEDWDESRIIVDTVEYWPNGNYKFAGKTLHGKRISLWYFFDEQGNRIRSVEYSTGETAKHDPGQPGNRGLGIPRGKSERGSASKPASQPSDD